MKAHIGLLTTSVVAIIISACVLVWWFGGPGLRAALTDRWNMLSHTKTEEAPTPSLPAMQKASDGVVSITVPEPYVIVTTKDQLPKTSYIPPCADGFTYCVYYNGTAYTGTNFDSAGIGIKKRDDLKDKKTCVNTAPDGYGTKQPDATNSHTTYATSVFRNLGDAGAGHYANDTTYRLFVLDTKTCYEITTRVAETQYANYPAGRIKEFTDTDKKQLASVLAIFVNHLYFANTSEVISFPTAQ